MGKDVRLIAFYFPQFYPIPENDLWWGKGFTEWTNVARAQPLFSGHYQPHIPADLGFYDLRLSEAREAQVSLARQYGIGGFCYWHYWFAGHEVLERPFNEVLNSGKPVFPFCLGWANESWTGVWNGYPGEIHIRQTYPGKEDERSHFYSLLKAFHDQRYIRINNKPVFLISRPHLIPNSRIFIDHWRELAEKEGLRGIYFIAHINSVDWDYRYHGYDAAVPLNPGIVLKNAFQWHRSKKYIFEHLLSLMLGRNKRDMLNETIGREHIFQYKQYIEFAGRDFFEHHDLFPCVISNWDDTPRRGMNGTVFDNSTPELFRLHLRDAILSVKEREPDERIVFIKSWNEWGEGNYLEPDQRFGHEYLRVCREEVL